MLDGLRGVAALLVVLFHLGGAYFQNYPQNPLRHAYLAVDFFFLLSGYVVGYAYDDRWSRMSVGKFLRIRLVRLHPLVLLGVALGALSYWFDPFAGTWQHVRLGHLGANVFFGLLRLPFVPLPNRYKPTRSTAPAGRCCRSTWLMGCTRWWDRGWAGGDWWWRWQ